MEMSDIVEALAGILEKTRDRIGLAAVISVAAIVVLFGLLAMSEYVINYKRIRKCHAAGRFRALYLALRYTYTYRFEECGYGLQIEKMLFQNAEKAVIPKGVTSIGSFAFSKRSLTSVSLPESLREIDDRAFEHCDIEELTIPSGVRHIGERAFFGCKRLRRVEMPLVPQMDFSAFDNCHRLKTVIVDGREREMLYGGSGVTFLLWYMLALELAEEGNGAAEDYIASAGGEMLRFFVEQDSMTSLERMLALPLALSSEAVDSGINAAISEKRHEMYIMLIQYKRSRLGFAEDSIAERFGL